MLKNKVRGWGVLSFAMVLLSVGASIARADSRETFLEPAWAREPIGVGATGLVFDDTYRIGDEWGKKPVTPEVLRTATPAFRRAAMATAKLGGGTAFYLGKFAGYHVLATNHHVCPAAWQCVGGNAQFPYLSSTTGGAARSFKVDKYFGTWSDVDLTLVGLVVTDALAEQELAAVAGNFDFAGELFTGENLLTIGFGTGDNPRRVMVANQDSDCKVFSGRGEYRFMGDPDALNPGPYKAWSFANGCDVSHGDSGSAMVDRETGKVVGIIWTGKIPKSSEVQSSAWLASLLARGGEQIWTELSYAVPAAKIGELLNGVVENPATDAATRTMLQDLLRR